MKDKLLLTLDVWLSAYSEENIETFKIEHEEKKILFWIRTFEGVEIEGKIKIIPDCKRSFSQRYELAVKLLGIAMAYGMMLGADIEMKV